MTACAASSAGGASRARPTATPGASPGAEEPRLERRAGFRRAAPAAGAGAALGGAPLLLGAPAAGRPRRRHLVLRAEPARAREGAAAADRAGLALPRPQGRDRLDRLLLLPAGDRAARRGGPRSAGHRSARPARAAGGAPDV